MSTHDCLLDYGPKAAPWLHNPRCLRLPRNICTNHDASMRTRQPLELHYCALAAVSFDVSSHRSAKSITGSSICQVVVAANSCFMHA
eukprot:4137370-Amphidinium_carterae.1